ncbi:MAG: ribonuclease H-like domain-containing protein, partial [Candidatus Aenigmatarchaeota archaeon]
MLRNTFLHVPGIGEKTERKIWDSGVKTWNDFLKSSGNLDIGKRKEEKLENYIQRSLKCEEENDYTFLKQNLPSAAHWRTYREMMEEDRCGFLDIETTGLSKTKNEVTVIGLYDGSESKIYVKGKNLNKFVEDVKEYDLLVTFNGKRFDLPFIRNHLEDVSFNAFHVDLMYDLR